MFILHEGSSQPGYQFFCLRKITGAFLPSPHLPLLTYREFLFFSFLFFSFLPLHCTSELGFFVCKMAICRNRLPLSNSLLIFFWLCFISSCAHSFFSFLLYPPAYSLQNISYITNDLSDIKSIFYIVKYLIFLEKHFLG